MKGKGKKIRIWAAVVLGLAGLLLLHTKGNLLRREWMTCLFWTVPLALLLRQLIRSIRSPNTSRAKVAIAVPAMVLSGFLLLHLFSSAMVNDWAYFLRWGPLTSFPVDFGSGLIRFAFLTALLWPLLATGLVKPRRLLLCILIFSQVACLWFFLWKTGGEALYRDDHPSFMFRLLEFSRTWPQLINYNPFWNGGGIGYPESTSGTTSLGIFLWPLWRFAEVHTVYTYALAFLFIVVVPLMTAGSLRMTGANWTAGICAGIISLGVSLHFFLWLLNYGTVGACFSLCFIVPFTAGVFRVVWLGKMEKWLAVVIVLSGFFLLQWPPGAIMAAPMVIGFLFSMRKWTKKKIVFLTLCAGAVVALYSRTIVLFMTEASSHMDYVLDAPGSGGGSGGKHVLNWKMIAEGFDHLLAHTREGHPLLPFLGILGVFVVPYRSVRRWFIPLVAGLALVTGWGQSLFPKLQLSRMGIPFLFISVVPAGIMLGTIMKSRGPRTAWARAALPVLLLLGGWNVSQLYANGNIRTRYVTMTQRAKDIVELIKIETPEDGRVLFAGCTKHVYGGGHVAHLVRLAGREMISCDYYHFPPETTEYEMPPRRWKKREGGVFEYMSIHNVTHVISYHEQWKKFFTTRPEQYGKLISFRDMTVFRVLRDSSLFMRGEGKVSADFNVIHVEVQDPAGEVVIKYNWISGMTAPEPVEIFPVHVVDDIRFIGIRPNGEKKFKLSYNSGL